MTGHTLTTISTYGSQGGSSRVRLFDWLHHLNLPATVLDYVGSGDNGPWSLARRAPDVLRAERRLRARARHQNEGTVVLSRSASPFSNGRLEQSLLESWEWSVYDFDDALFDNPEAGYTRMWSKRSTWRRCVQAADVVIGGSEYLAERAGALSRRVVMIPSCVAPEAYRVKTDYRIGRNYPLAVWMGSPSTEQYLIDVAEPLRALHDTLGLRLKVVSAGQRSLGALDGMVDRVDWSQETFSEELAGADFGIMPLRDDPYARGKCAYKLLQYAAAGLPLIGDAVGANARALGLLGGLSTSDGGWFEAITAMTHASASDRGVAGLRARQGVVRHYSFAAWESTWLATVMPHLPVEPLGSSDIR